MQLSKKIAVQMESFQQGHTVILLSWIYGEVYVCVCVCDMGIRMFVVQWKCSKDNNSVLVSLSLKFHQRYGSGKEAEENAQDLRTGGLTSQTE